MASTRKPPARKAAETKAAPKVVEPKAPWEDLDGHALSKAALQAREVTVTMPYDAFLVGWEMFERKSASAYARSFPEQQTTRTLLRGREAFRQAHGEVEGARTAAKERTESVGVRKVQRRTPPKRG